MSYTRSIDGSNADSGATWALAFLDLPGATTADVAGETLHVSHVHAESTAAAITIAVAGTNAAPSKIICANDAAEPPTAAATTATVTSTSNITLTGSFYCSGITFNAGSGASAAQSLLIAGSTSNHQTYEDCSLRILTTGTGIALIQLGDEARSDSTRVNLRDTTLRFGGVNNRVKVGGCLKIEGGSIVSGSATPTSVFLAGLRGMGEFLVSNFDFSNLGTGFHLVAVPSGGNAFTARFRNLTLPNGWTGNLWSSIPVQPSIRAELYNSFAGATKIRLWARDYAGEVRDNTTVVRTGGASDDGTPFSIRLASTADAEYPSIPLECTQLRHYVDATASTTLSLEIVHDSQGSGTAGALRDDEIGLKVSYPGGFVDTFKADALVAAADHTSSVVGWTTTGLTTPVKQKLSVTFTPTSKGDVIITPVLFGASKTVYICPLLGS